MADFVVEITAERWPLRAPFRFTGFTVEALDTVHIAVSDGRHRGQGEGVVPVVFDITLAEVLADAEAARAAIADGGDPNSVCAALPAGPARNALDCALWDWRAKATGESIWRLAGLDEVPTRITVDQSIGLGAPEAMAEAAARSDHHVLKLKLDTTLIVERVAAVRRARPDAEVIVDANQAWSPAALGQHAPALAALGVAMIEQPLQVGEDRALADFKSPVPLYADESCHTRADLPRLAGRYQGINIKLDKTGGLTEALALAAAAKAQGMGLMVGCMAGTSLSMAPAYVIASLCNWADLDGPLLLAGDRVPAMAYRSGMLDHFSPALWG
jgi:L-Ala-D/L-Glu epimerase